MRILRMLGQYRLFHHGWMALLLAFAVVLAGCKVQRHDGLEEYRRIDIPINALTLAWHPTSQLIAVGGFGGMLTVWEIEAGKLIKDLHQENGIVDAVEFSPDGSLLAVGKSAVQHGAYVTLLETTRFQPTYEFESPNVASGKKSPPVHGIAFFASSNKLAISSYSDGSDPVILSLERPSKPVRLLPIKTNNAAEAIAVRQTNKQVAVCRITGELEIHSADGGEPVQQIDAHHRWPCQALVFSPDSKYVFTGSNAGMQSQAFDKAGAVRETRVNEEPIKMWDADSLRLVRTFQTDRGYVQSMSLSSDGQHLFAGVGVGDVRIWNTSSGVLERHLKGFGSSVIVAVSPDNRFLATAATGDRFLTIWKITK